MPQLCTLLSRDAFELTVASACLTQGPVVVTGAAVTRASQVGLSPLHRRGSETIVAARELRQPLLVALMFDSVSQPSRGPFLQPLR